VSVDGAAWEGACDCEGACESAWEGATELSSIGLAVGIDEVERDEVGAIVRPEVGGIVSKTGEGCCDGSADSTGDPTPEGAPVGACVPGSAKVGGAV
jgi:hypothetical protein